MVVAEYFAVNLTVDKAHICLVHPGTSYASLAHDIQDGSLSLSGVKVLVLAIGRQDVLDQNVWVQDSLMRVRSTINAVEPAVTILVCTPLPWPTDRQQVMREIFCTSVMLRHFCEPDSTLQYI